ncbi:hypothetical protein [Barrientosiimonas humi]|nr:hypothetical protein [Barrientosiimonas humi]
MMLSLQLAAVFSRGTSQFWARESGSALDWALASSPLVAACVAGVACYQAQVCVPGRQPHEALAQVRTSRAVILSSWPAVAGGITSTVLVVGIALLIVLRTRGDLPLPHTWGLLIVALCMDAAAGAAGAILGLILRGPIVPFLVAILGFLGFFVAGSVGIARLLRIGGSTGSVSDFSVSWPTVGIWCAALLTIPSMLVLMVGWVRGSPRLLSSTPITVLCLAVVAGLFWVLAADSGGQGYVYQLKRDTPDRCASQDGITVCSRSSSAFDPASTAEALAPYEQVVRSLRPGGSKDSRWNVVSVAGEAPPGRLIIANSTGAEIPMKYELSEGALGGSGCPRLVNSPKFVSVLTVAGEWVAYQVTNEPVPGTTAAQLEWLRSPEGRSWTARAAAAIESCDVAGVPAPRGWGSQESGLTW